MFVDNVTNIDLYAFFPTDLIEVKSRYVRPRPGHCLLLRRHVGFIIAKPCYIPH